MGMPSCAATQHSCPSSASCPAAVVLALQAPSMLSKDHLELVEGVVLNVAGSAHTEGPQQCAIYWQQAGPHLRQHPVVDLQAT